MGLKDTHHIGRILIHPTNPNIVYVAAAGHLWGPNEERGVFKTIDGGKTWVKALSINSDTGVNDIAMDIHNPDTIFAAAYQRRRTPFGMNGGGPGSAIYRTTDGGASWKKLTKGLPEEDLGRIGLDVYRRNGNIVYALVESQQPALYRSDDKGETWAKMSNTNPRPMYFSNVRIDPNNDQRIWVLGVSLHYSEDGGKTFKTERGSNLHSDHHAMWIDPANSDNIVDGCDGGIHFSRDAGRHWDQRAQIALGQFYKIGLDNAKPYKICGGLQDNYTWCGPSATTFSHGITNEDWYQVQGGDGFYAQIDPEEPWIVYAESQDGNLSRRDLRTHEARSIRPREDNDTMDRFRFQWDSPITISKHDRKTLYYGGNFVFKSTDQGDNWRRNSPDLTTNTDRNTLSIMGKSVSDRKMLATPGRNSRTTCPVCPSTTSPSTHATTIWSSAHTVARSGFSTASPLLNKPRPHKMPCNSTTSDQPSCGAWPASVALMVTTCSLARTHPLEQSSTSTLPPSPTRKTSRSASSTAQANWYATSPPELPTSTPASIESYGTCGWIALCYPHLRRSNKPTAPKKKAVVVARAAMPCKARASIPANTPLRSHSETPR